MDKVEAYQKKHRRCRTCQHSKDIDHGWAWVCTAKGVVHMDSVFMTGLKGCFCKLYSPCSYNSPDWGKWEDCY